MRRLVDGFLITGLLSWWLPRPCMAGMPSVSFTDIAAMRLSTISFFGLVLLGCAWIVRQIWNSLASDFPQLPILSYKKALGLVTLWGLLFVLVLTMISGARELLTPGAWVKDGLTYKLASSKAGRSAETDESPPVTSPRQRHDALERLASALWNFARNHNERFPRDRDNREIPRETWRVPDPSGMSYFYVPAPDSGPDQSPTPLVYEPGIFGPTRLVLLTNREIVSMSAADIQLSMPKSGPAKNQPPLSAGTGSPTTPLKGFR